MGSDLMQGEAGGMRDWDGRAAGKGAEAGAPVLVVEDDADARALVADVLREEGYAVLEAADGAQALAWAREIAPRLIILDLRLPVLDGWGFAQAYRALPGPHAPLLVLTGAADPVAWTAEVGGITCLAKPFQVERLLLLVRHLAAVGRGEGAPLPTAADATEATEATDATEAGEAGAAPLLAELAVELAERQYLVAALEEVGPDREPKVLASRLERNRTRGSVLLSQLAALVPPDGPSLT